MIDREILQELHQATIAAVLASSTPDMPIAFVDVDFIRPNDGKYIECVFIPNNPDDQFWNDNRNYQGMWRLVLHWPKAGGGAYDPMDVLASIMAYFRKDTPLGALRVASNPNFMGRLVEATEILYPASLRYQRFN